MDKEKCCCGHCLCLWFSGLFAMPAIMHLVRIVLGWSITVGEHHFTTRESVVVIIISGILSAIFGMVGCKLSGKKEDSCGC